ncbi:BRO family protein [Rhodococcus qingshengii]|uniref:BRO family protein n=1 Tax=Rhodococcus qingshengii TaxID=334542 RepID=UPI002109EFB9|nr:BRO family protein [Rhodococcus qingshengii]MCQ4148617.1 BRO family protein [Rhodococcus qingshengii]
MSIERFSYESTEIRTADIDGKRWAVALDICQALDIKDVRTAVQRLDEADRVLTPIRSGGQNRNMWVVSEDGATDLVLDSRKPEARRFRRFLTHEVWPAIRDTGTYSAAPALTDDELIHQALSISATRVAALTERVAELEPKAEYVDIFVAGSDVMSFRTVASTLDISEGWLRRELIDRKWIYVEETSRWSNSKGCKIPVRRYSERSDKKAYFQRCETHEAPRFRGEVMHTLKITAEGAQAISRMVPRWMKEEAA